MNSSTGGVRSFGATRRRILGFAALLVCIGAIWAVYGPSTAGEFLNWDDDRNFVHNPDFQGLARANLGWAWNTFHLGVWQPLAWCLLSVQHAVAGLDATIYRRTSLLFHAANMVMLYFVLTALLHAAKIDASESALQLWSVVGALAFAVHPLRVEAVAWVSAQPYLPAVFFYLSAVLIHVRAYQCPRPVAVRSVACLAALACYVLAVGFKAAAVSLPVVLFVLDVFPLRRWGRDKAARTAVLVEKLPMLAVASLVCLWATHAKDYADSRTPLAEFDASARLAQSAYGLVFYLWKSIAPTGLSAYYRLPEDISWTAPPYLACCAALVLLTLVLVAARRRCPAALTAWVCYVVVLLPHLGLVQISQQLAADRYSYLAAMGPLALAVAAMARSWTRWPSIPPKAAAVTVSALLLFALGIHARRVADRWRSSEVLWRSVLATDPRCAVAVCNLGAAHLSREQFDQAEPLFLRALELEPDFSFAHTNLGVSRLAQGRFDGAIAALLKALSARPPLGRLDLARTHAALGAAYAGTGDYEPAWEHTLEAKRLGFEKAQAMIERLERMDPRSRNQTP